MTNLPQFRLATLEDLPAITDILNEAIDRGGLTAYTERVNLTEREGWFANHSPGRWPVFVLELGSRVVGWCSYSPHRPGRKSLARLAEITYYLHPDAQGRGLGSTTVDFLVAEGRKRGFRHLFAIIMDTNVPSIRLLEKKGFALWGVLPEVAEIAGQLTGQVYYGCKL